MICLTICYPFGGIIESLLFVYLYIKIKNYRMNSYSWIQQKLHYLALSSQLIRETAYDIESSIISHHENLSENVFISGLARSGTTILLNAIYKSNEFSSLSYADMPFILAPNIWSKINLNHQTELSERAMVMGSL